MKIKKLPNLVLGFVALLMGASQAMSSTTILTSTKTVDIPKRASDLFAIITDYENQCATCARHLSNVREIKVLGNVNNPLFYTWMYIDSIKDSSSFAQNMVTKAADGSQYVITASIPKADVVSRLSSEYNLAQNSLFIAQDCVWQLTETKGADGQFKSTKVMYSVKATSEATSIHIFRGKAQKELDKTTVELFSLLGSRL